MRCKNNKEEKKLLNCICEVNIDGKMALVSLYDDLPHFEYDLTIDNLKNSVTKLKSFVQELKQRIKKLENENANFHTVNNVLSKNITSLYKTASIEIQRKDKIIDDLRKSQIVPSTSKMFSSTVNFQIEKTEDNKPSERKKNIEQIENTIEKTKDNKPSESKKNIEQIENTIEKTKVLNPNNNDNITTVVIKPNRDIPKTIYYKRMCQKLAQQNDTISSKKQILQQIENNNTTDKITQDKNEELNKDENTLKEMSTSLIHNESKDIINSTLVICESDITPSDCELDTTPVVQSDNQEKDKENVSTESLFSKLKQPTKLKKKLIISPATIGVQNTNYKFAKKIDQINSLASTTKCEITNSPKKQIIKSLNKYTLTTCNTNNFPEFVIKTENKPFTTDILHNQQLFTLENKQIPSTNIKFEQFPIRRKKKVVEKDENTLALINMKKSSQITITCMSPSIDNECNKSIENDKCLSVNNERESLSPSQQKNNQSKCNLDTLKCTNDIKESRYLNNSCKSSSKDTSIETSPTNITVLSSIKNIEVKQVPITRKTKAVKRNNNNLNKSNDIVYSSCIKDHENKYDSKTDYKQLSTDTLHNQKLSSYDNKKQTSSINIEVEQVPFLRKTKVLENNNNTLNRFKKVTQDSCVKDHENKYDSKTDDKQLSTDSSHNQKLSTTYDNKKQTSSINIEVEQVPFLRKTKVLENNNNTLNRFKKVTQDSCVKDHENKYGLKTDDKELSTDILCNQKLSTCEKINQNKEPSINIEVEQFPIRRRKTVIEKDNNSIILSNVRKRSVVNYMTSSIDIEVDKSTENVKLLSMINDREPSSPSKQKNNQSTCNLDTFKGENSITESKQLNNSCKNSSINTSVEISPTNKTVIPSINIEVEQGSIFRHSNARKVIMRSTDDKQETKKGRHVQLITIKDHYSTPVSSFNGAKKTEIDVSKKSILLDKVVESSSHFYVPQVKKRRVMNFSSSDS